MAKFQISGTDKDGKRRRWLIEANNASGAMKKAENSGITVNSIDGIRHGQVLSAPRAAGQTTVEVNVHTGSDGSNSFGVSSLVVAILSFFFCWLPLIGLGLGLLALALGITGIIVSHGKKFDVLGYSLAGIAVSTIAIVFGFQILLPNAREQQLPAAIADQPKPPENAITERNADVVKAKIKSPFRLGNLEITATGIELKRLNEKAVFGRVRPRDSFSYVLTFTAKNISRSQVFSAFSVTESVTDEFGNNCKDALDKKYASVELPGNELTRMLQPGESVTHKLAFDPVSISAREFAWTISTKTSSQEDYRKWRLDLKLKQASTAG
ncbi:MAG: hypothetical protein KDA87_15275 [Planctomycetales bacterium]|nr:hypothetical protein [Planctomycetales bacterium]